MRKKIIDTLWEYEVIKNGGKGLKGYGYTLKIFKNGVLVNKLGAFGNEKLAILEARAYFLANEFDIWRD